MKSRTYYLAFVIVFSFVLLLSGTSKAASDIQGWGGFKWGDSIEKVKKSVKVIKMSDRDKKAFDLGLWGEPQIGLLSEKVIDGKTWNVLFIFVQKTKTLEAVILNCLDYLTGTNIKGIHNTLVKKYGEPECSEDYGRMDCEWYEKSGYLKFAVQAKDQSHTKFKPVTLLYKQKKTPSSKELDNF